MDVNEYSSSPNRLLPDDEPTITDVTFGDDDADDGEERPVVEIDNVGVFVNETFSQDDIEDLSDTILVSL